ncbi:TonB-dependent receptor plug domain-containing protein [Duganella dendranthematis]|jgi:outer membrane receptor protein involved in Fe transport|uniref:TonB-dependent receptor plug domain-containing protein n=2 Tax=Duganella dendranthematis TaxID=2728021 RepID=A0ABX6MCE0_9BURK|nr:TonB-dependent receptor plug domain-containing protein [Duganella dendranthematis]
MLRKTVLVNALSLAFSAAALSVAVVQPVMAQSNASGNIFGQIDSPSGASIQVENKETGLKRTALPESGGRFQLSALPVGRYTVQLIRDGKAVQTTEVEVQIGQGVDASFTAAVQAVQVTGRRSRIDVSSTNSGATFTAKELAKLPITPSVASIIQLAPNTTRGDSRYGDGNAPSFGGSAASENAFYINGFPVTNVLFQVGTSELPFGAIGQAQVLTGGFGAEFGRSTGGVINISTKSGTNTWEVGGSVSTEPNSLRAKAKNIYYGKNGQATDGKLYTWNQDNTRDSTIANVFVGGPIIKDKLFLYANLERTKTDMDNTRVNADSATAALTGWEERRDTINRGLVKVDWNINDNHRLEATYITDDPKSERSYYGFNYTPDTAGYLTHGSTKNGGAHYESYGPTPVAARVGADIRILNYTGNLSDDVTVTAMIGGSTTRHVFTPFNYNPNVFQVSAPAAARIPGFNYTTTQTTSGSILTDGAQDKQKVMNLNLQYKVGDHTVRAGMDQNKISSVAGTSRAGGGLWVYAIATNPNLPINGSVPAPASNGGYGTQGYYVSRNLTSGVSTPSVDQDAQYIEDTWQVTPKIILKGGLRNEQFTNFNGDGQAYISMRHQLAPRLGATWDALGDSSLKVFGNLGRYHLQMPTNVAVRAAGASLNTQQYYTYTGTDPVTGAPTGLTPLGSLFSANNEFGQSKDPRQVAAQNMDSLYQDELILGFERAYSANLNFGAKLTYRKLKSTIDDFCDQRPFDKYAAEHGIENHFVFGCALFNPGKDNDFLVDYAGDGVKLTNVHLTAAELGYPEVKRSYAALDLFAEHPLRNGWYGKINYTLSRNSGNTEGQTRSDSGQADVSTTAVFDYPELTLNSDGLLPNDRKHQLKAYGFYQFTDELSVGGNLLVASGRPKNCIGNLPDSYYTAGNPATDYGSEFFFCNGEAAPRGSRGRMPWDTRLDLNVAYQPRLVKGLVLKADVFNVFNRQTAQNQTESYNTGKAVNALYGNVISYTAPRSIKLTAEYNYKF